MDETTLCQFTPVYQKTKDREAIRYALVLRQQPKQSRMCGVGEKADRRPIDPPPIIQARIDAGSSECTSFLQNPYFFMYASLVPPDSDEELHLLRDGKTRSTTGSVVSSLYHLKDIDNSDAGFFVFPDLSVRMEGSYRLKMSLFEIVGLDVHYCASVFTDVFTVYSAKRFPGMEESTFLSRSFADQGLKIRIRKEIRARTHQRKQLRSSTDAESSSAGIKRMRLDSIDDSSSMVGSDEASDSESKEDTADLSSGVVGPPTLVEPASQHRLYDIRLAEQPNRPRAATHVFPNRPSVSLMEEYRSRSHSFGYEPRYSAPLHPLQITRPDETTYQFTPQSDLAKYSVNANKLQQRSEQQRSEQQRSEQQRSEQQRSEQQRSEQQRSRQQRPEHQRPEHQRPEHQRPEHQRPEHQRPEHQRPEQQPASGPQRLPPIASLAPPIPSNGAYPPPPPGAYYYPPPPGYYPPQYYYPYHPPQ